MPTLSLNFANVRNRSEIAAALGVPVLAVSAVALAPTPCRTPCCSLLRPPSTIVEDVSFVRSPGSPASLIRTAAQLRIAEVMICSVFSSFARRMDPTIQNHAAAPPPSAKDWDIATMGCSRFHRSLLCALRPLVFLGFLQQIGRRLWNPHATSGSRRGTSAIFTDIATKMASGIFVRRHHSKTPRASHFHSLLPTQIFNNSLTRSNRGTAATSTIPCLGGSALSPVLSGMLERQMFPPQRTTNLQGEQGGDR